MANCKACDGIGTIECPDCINNLHYFYTGQMCPTCRGEMVALCKGCKGTGVEPEKQK